MLVGLVHALALLLLVAAAAKLREPGPAMVALRRAGLPSGSLVVRLLATTEAAVAAATLLVGGVGPAVALGLLHLGFACFIARLRRVAGAKASCGCFGEAEAPADRLHVVVNLVAAGAVALAVAFPLPSVPSVLADGIGLALPYMTVVVIGAWATGLCLTSLPSLLAAQRQVAS